MSRSRTTAGKLQIQAQKRAKAQAKIERREARGTAAPEDASEGQHAPEGQHATESELIDGLADLHRSLEAGELPLNEFEERREQIRGQMERLQR